MLSFTRGDPIAVALDKDDKVVFTINITEEKDNPDIKADNPRELISDEDIGILRKTMKFGSIELKMLKKALMYPANDNGKIDRSSLNLSSKLKNAVEVLEEIACEKLKNEIDFTKSSEIVRVIPLIGTHNNNFDRSIYATGPSGCGKSTLMCKIAEFDRKKRPVIIFSKVINDASLKPLKKLKTPKDDKTRLIQIPLRTEDDLLSLPSEEDLRGCIVLFDDIDSFRPEISEFLQDYRNNILETGRHFDITCLSTSHQLYNWNKTRTMLNEAELIACFPNSNKRSSDLLLRDRMGMEHFERKAIINKAKKAGRFMILKLSSPNMIIHNKGCILI